MKIIIECEPREIAALALELQKRRPPAEIDLDELAKLFADGITHAAVSWLDDTPQASAPKPLPRL